MITAWKIICDDNEDKELVIRVGSTLKIEKRDRDVSVKIEKVNNMNRETILVTRIEN